MQFEWKDRSDHDRDILELATDYINTKLIGHRRLIRQREVHGELGDFLFLSEDSMLVRTIQRLLAVDFEWLYEYMQLPVERHDELPLLATTHPSKVIPHNYEFVLCKHKNPRCEYSGLDKTCQCVGSYIYVVQKMNIPNAI